MKSLFKKFLLVAGIALAVLSPVQVLGNDLSAITQTETEYDSIDIGDVIDAGEETASNLNEFTDDLLGVLTGKGDETCVAMVNLLDKAGLQGGWAKQIGSLKRVSGVLDAFGKVLNVLKAGNTVKKLYDAYQADDKEAFANIVADQLADAAAGAVAGLISNWIKTQGTAIVIGSSVIAPGVGTVVAIAGVWVVSWAAGEGVDRAIHALLEKDEVRAGLVGVGNMIWDLLHHQKNNDDDPFDSLPSNQDGEKKDSGHFQGLKPIELVR